MGEFPANGDATGDYRGRSDLEATGSSVPDTGGAGGLDRRQEDAAPDPIDLDLLSASLRADASDTETFFEVLSEKLVAALGERVSLEREGGLFRRDHRVREISVELGSQVLTVSRSKGRLSCHARRRVRGVVLRTEELDLDTWLGSLARGLADEARRSAATRTTLQSLLT